MSLKGKRAFPIENDQRKCRLCLLVKPISAYQTRRYGTCKECNAKLKNDYYHGKRNLYIRDRTAANRYGVDISIASKRREGSCEICGALAKCEKEGTLVIDHDHTTGKFRGFLCHACNMAIGKMLDSPSRLRAAAEYIEKHMEEG